MKIAVVGATGLVGAALTEALLQDPAREVVPLIRSAGNAWALARHGIDLRSVDLLAPDSIASPLEDCTHVVNCSRGDEPVMLKGLKNLLKQCKQQNVRKFVHLSSVAVYGDPPPAESVNESADTQPAKGSYGWIKLQQDKMVQSAARSGLPATVLCPPNILGPGSYFLAQLLDSISGGRFLLADDGQAVCCAVDLANLVHAIVVALDADVDDGERLFITDGEDTTWGQIVERLVPLAINAPVVQTISQEQLRAKMPAPEKNSLSLLNAIKHLFSSDVRLALRHDPLIAAVDTGLRGAVAGLGTRVEDKMRHFIAGPIQVPARSEPGPVPDLQLSLQQLRGIRHSCERARERLGYRPIVSCDEGLQAFSRWYRELRGFDSDISDLSRHLY